MRRLIIAFAIIFALLAAALPASAAATAGRLFVGQVTAIAGPTLDPTSFTLQTTESALIFRVARNVRFLPRSAEAAVEGFGVGDYAIVAVAGPPSDPEARTVRFDVQPWPALKRFPLVGTVLREAPNGKWFSLRTANERTWFLRVTPRTTFLSAGTVLSTPQPLIRGEQVSVVARNRPGHSVALEIDVNPVTPISRAR